PLRPTADPHPRRPRLHLSPQRRARRLDHLAGRGLPGPARRPGGDRRHHRRDHCPPRGHPADPREDRRLDLQEPAWPQRLEAGRRSRLARQGVRRGDVLAPALELHDQHRRGDRGRPGGSWRGGARGRSGQDRRAAGVGDQAHRAAFMTGRVLGLIAATLVLGVSLTLGACQHEGHRPPCPPGALCLSDGNGAEPTSLDPAHFDGVWEANIVSQLIVGLTDIDADGKPKPAVATSWETSPDGLTWTFHLRHDVKWSDGTPVTSADFVYGIQRVLDPKTASYSAFILFPFLKNAEAVNAGKLPLSAAGIEAPDPYTVVFRLSHPWPLLPAYAAGRAMWLEPRAAIQRWGDKWAKPGHYLSDGPSTLADWRLGDAVVLRKNPLYFDAGKVCFNEVD